MRMYTPTPARLFDDVEHSHPCPTCQRSLACRCVKREPDSPMPCGSTPKVCIPKEKAS